MHLVTAASVPCGAWNGLHGARLVQRALMLCGVRFDTAENAVPIESWFDNPADEELLNLLPLLAALRHVDDVRSILSMRTH